MQIEVHLRRIPEGDARPPCVLKLLTLNEADGNWTIPLQQNISIADAAYHVNNLMESAVEAIPDADRRFLSDKKLSLTISNSKVPYMVLKDLPGMVNFPASDKAIIDNLIGQQINAEINNSIFLLVVNASEQSPLAQSNALTLCETYGIPMTVSTNIKINIYCYS
jgi:hypothetical protein